MQYHLLLTFYYTSLSYDFQVDLLAVLLNMPKGYYIKHPQNIDRNGIQHMVYLYITKHSTRESFEIIIITITKCVRLTIQAPLKKNPQIVTLRHSERHTMQAQILATCENAQSKITNSWR